MIAEAWDIESYLLGRAFPGLNWRQWNGKYRDDLRDFVRGVPDVWARSCSDSMVATIFSPTISRTHTALSERKLYHRARRFLSIRPGLLRPQTQRAERPRQYRWH